jgi:ATP-dependent Clp endopeptidase proteolytic subunit ClpP
MPRNKSWFTMKQTADLAEIQILDEIDPMWGMGAKEFKAEFDKIKDAKNIKLWLNSAGGSIFEGQAIYNILSSVSGKLDVEVIGIAASMASVIALAGKKLTMAEGSYLMIHNPMTAFFGDGDALRKTADILDKMRQEYIAIYSKKTGLDAEKVGAMMTAETWMTSSEAIANGFADDTEDYGQVAACADPAIVAKYGFNNIPESLVTMHAHTPRELEAILRDAGFGKKDAVAIVANGFKALERGEPAKDRGEPDKLETDSETTVTTDQIKTQMAALCALAGI